MRNSLCSTSVYTPPRVALNLHAALSHATRGTEFSETWRLPSSRIHSLAASTHHHEPTNVGRILNVACVVKRLAHGCSQETSVCVFCRLHHGWQTIQDNRHSESTTMYSLGAVKKPRIAKVPSLHRLCLDDWCLSDSISLALCESV